MSKKCGPDVSGGLIGGAVIATVGVIFLLDNIGILSFAHLVRFWPMILVASGLASLPHPRIA